LRRPAILRVSQSPVDPLPNPTPHTLPVRGFSVQLFGARRGMQAAGPRRLRRYRIFFSSKIESDANYSVAAAFLFLHARFSRIVLHLLTRVNETFPHPAFFPSTWAWQVLVL